VARSAAGVAEHVRLMAPHIISLSADVEAEISSPAADQLLAGHPEQRIWNFFADPTQQFFAGRWSSTQGTWRVRYTENELCVIVGGKVVLTSDAGARHAFGPGDAFIVPAGFCGSWEVTEDCTKIYAIFESRS
jgi:uncharacterized cupin superfamily protein